jgi:hypothetical protein
MTEPLAAQMRAQADKWRRDRAHTYASENADLYRAGDAVREDCATALDAFADAAEKEQEEWRRGAVLRTRTYEAEIAKASAREAALLAQLEACDEARQSNADGVAPLVAALAYIRDNPTGWKGKAYQEAVQSTAQHALTAAPERARALVGLVEKWGREQADYPDTIEGRHAAAAVRACARELDAALGMEVGDA